MHAVLTHMRPLSTSIPTLALCVFLFGGDAFAEDSFAQPGSFNVGVRNVTVSRDDGTTFEMQLFYPADTGRN